MDDPVKTIIACAPVWIAPEPPPEQVGCKEEPCPRCGQGMWVSEKKRAIREKGIDCMCMECVVRETQGMDTDVVDILNRH